MIEEQNTITFAEFKAWIVGLITGKNGTIPDLEDWIKIKQMMDKVVPEKEIVIRTEPSGPRPYHHDIDPHPVRTPWESPYQYPNWPHPYIGDPLPQYGDQPWCSGTYTQPNVDASVHTPCKVGELHKIEDLIHLDHKISFI